MKLQTQPRNKVTLNQFLEQIREIEKMAEIHLETYGDGVFISPHEILGMATDQMQKLTTVSTNTVYSGAPEELITRCKKFAIGLIFGAASMKANSKE